MKDATPATIATWCSFISRKWEIYSLCLQILHLKDVYEYFEIGSIATALNMAIHLIWMNFDSLASYYGFGKHGPSK